MILLNSKVFALSVLGLAASPSFADLTYPGCADMTGADFTITALVSNATDTTVREPTKMALTTNAQGNVDIYFVQRYGRVRKYDGTTRVTTTVANFNFGRGTSMTDTTQLYNGSSEGLQGIALDPAFATNHWVYLYFVLKNNWRITRYTLAGASLDVATAKTILRFTHTSIGTHPGSVLRFDQDGNLWITVGDNGGNTWPNDQTVPYLAANTSRYFGKILRIKPRPLADNATAPAPGVGSTYDIPAGNLRQRFFEIGGAWVAGQDTNKILPEIYVMGTRNAYTLALDTVRKGVAWADMGPENFAGSTDSNQWIEEFNFTTQPGNFGWPMWAGKRTPMPTAGWSGYTGQLPPSGGFGAMATPLYSRPDSATAITHLPPAQPALINYVKSAPITGPVYYYRGNDTNRVRFPPHLNGAWFVGDFNSPWINAVELNASGTAVLSMRKMFSVSAVGSPASFSVPATGNSLRQIPSTVMNNSNSILEMQMGSDGAMYIINYSGFLTSDARTGLVRITYNGACQPATPIFAKAPKQSLKSLLSVQGMNVSVLASGNHTLEVRNLLGEALARREGQGHAQYSFDELKQTGVYLLYLSSAEGYRSQKLIRE